MILAALVVLCLIGVLVQGVMSATAARRYPPVGRMVSVGDHAMHLYCTGEGGPTVVLESGLNEGALSWSAVQPALSATNRVCSYDRSGTYWSEPSKAGRSSDVIAQELMTLLTNAGEKGPFVLVGHSIGGLHVRAFSARYPDQVVGMVLVDSSHEEQNSRLGYPSWTNLAFRVQVLVAHTGIFRFLNLPTHNWPALSADLKPAYRELGYQNQNSNEFLQEKLAADELEATGVQANSIRPDLPLAVLSQGGAGIPPAQYQASVEMHKELAALSSRSTHTVVSNSGHFIQVDQPQVVIDAVNQVIGQVAGRN